MSEKKETIENKWTKAMATLDAYGELLPCPFCGNPAQYFRDDRAQSVNCFECNLSMDFNHFPTFEDAQRKLFAKWNTRHSKYPLAPVSSTLDRLLAGFDGAAEGEADLGKIMHKGEKVAVKIKVVRGE